MVFPAFPFVFDAQIVQAAGQPGGVHTSAAAHAAVSVLEIRPEKITVSMGNFSSRKWVLKK